VDEGILGLVTALSGETAPGEAATQKDNQRKALRQTFHAALAKR